MRAAHIYADLSSARRLKVGAIVVKDDRIISIGYNGMPAGWDNNCEDVLRIEQVDGFVAHIGAEQDESGYYRLKTKPEVLHAEMNALMKLARSNESGLDSAIFVTHSPCLDCAKGIYQAGITQVYYYTDYRSTDGIEFLKKCGIKVEQVSFE